MNSSNPLIMILLFYFVKLLVISEIIINKRNRKYDHKAKT